jgi:deazaflavin-dependent oxidoreductase (nitroreductase family)
VSDFNTQIIQEFRANDGKVGGGFEGAPLLLLHTTGAKSGQPRVAPVAYLADGDRWLVFASKAGAPTNPDWYHNLLANPEASIEIGTDNIAVVATELEGEERDRLFAKQVEVMPGFGEYQTKAGRVIPVVALTRRT